MNAKFPPLIAVIGSDGSGKSTVCEHLIEYVKHYGPAVQVHLGKQAGNVGRAAAKLPLLGRSVGKAIESNTKKVKTKKSRIGLLPSAVIIAFVGRRLLRFRRMLAFRRQGYIVLTDRFPQAQIPGAYDGTVFPVDVEGSRFVRWLAARERAAFQWMAKQKPDLVLKLNVSLDVACARKPDHRKAALEKKIAVTPLLTFEGADIVDLDADRPIEEVLAAAEKAIAEFMVVQGYRYSADGASPAAR
ncbi:MULTISPECIES: thymidylate kinase [Serratia]|uniref:thymidylate kinase n=1 Tax=Serratia TaxID=613 RepID=UPI0018E74F86|nr:MULTISPECIES: thymidylate kinase [Serratia]MBJ2096966.1 thymidylate kinase [Serratia ureilytica]CAI2440752.1 Thymidylate kinase [Serratia marcescens]CAI2780932.1 Thymidylate kinase [Serratia marcescens]